MVDRARGGDLAAIGELLDRLVVKVGDGTDPDLVEAHELKVLKAAKDKSNFENPYAALLDPL